jgi:GT2 family glycosyltransferase
MSHATGEIIVRVDGHCELDPDYVSNCVEVLESGRAEGVGGPIETIGDGAVAEAIAIAMSSKFGVGGSAFRTVNDRELYTDTVAFPGYRSETIRRAGRFDEELIRNQDDEYNFRIRELGGRILLSPSIRSRYFSRSSFRSLWRQYFQYGYWKVRVLQLHPRQMSARQFVPFVFVTTLLILSLASLFSTIALWTLLAVLVSYTIVNIAASVVVGRARVTRVPLIAFSFLILHVSYGLGSLRGLVAFRKRWRESRPTRPRLASG